MPAPSDGRGPSRSIPSQPIPSQSIPTTRFSSSRSGRLLIDAAAALGAPRLAALLGLAEAQLCQVIASERQMSLGQQRLLATALLTLDREHAKLRRGAAALLRQVQAAEDYATGVTETHRTPPRSAYFWK